MTTVQGLLDLLADERDRLHDQVLGVQIAIDAGCVGSVITSILLPGVGFLIGAVARAACSVGNSQDLQRRIHVVEGLIVDVERLGTRIALVDETNAEAMQRAEAEVLGLLDRLRDVDILDNFLDTQVANARAFVASVRNAIDTASGLAGAAVVVGAGLWLYFRSRKK